MQFSHAVCEGGIKRLLSFLLKITVLLFSRVDTLSNNIGIFDNVVKLQLVSIYAKLCP